MKYWKNYILYMTRLLESRKTKYQIEFSTVHIVSGESTAGTLRYGLGRGNKVIGFPDFFLSGRFGSYIMMSSANTVMNG